MARLITPAPWRTQRPIHIQHAATLGGRFPPNSLAGLAACLAAGITHIEIDVTPLADGEFALLHDAAFDAATDGQGPVQAATAEQARAFRLRWRDAVTAEPVGTLQQAVALVAGQPGLTELQLDLKPHTALPAETLAGLLRQLAPIQRRVRVTSTADWALRGLRALDAGLALGFDPLLYLDVERGGSDGRRAIPPRLVGAFGYLDDHPLAADRWGTPAEYFAARAEVLIAQAPASVWYVRAALLARALADGFDWIGWLRLHGIQTAAWTLNPAQPHHRALAARLTALGVDRITTEDVAGWAAAGEASGPAL